MTRTQLSAHGYGHVTYTQLSATHGSGRVTYTQLSAHGYGHVTWTQLSATHRSGHLNAFISTSRTKPVAHRPSHVNARHFKLSST